jgi:hypothetical protein
VLFLCSSCLWIWSSRTSVEMLLDLLSLFDSVPMDLYSA